ncbi:hypothetical protein GH741_04105 [Aquibacillus halophilus]|uniref:Lipoprotein n=1 Tax=Aquibacillus halophilus TaxID=930132 RepID=A0A6A8D7X6_9BACI|nr:hypothetical protein [Aquibacillus halophilus]MRH41855.1 hypothetical protein [Aquibacillus halophilus]
MKNGWLLFVLIFFLMGCSSEESPAITKKDVVSEEPSSKPELIENETKENNEQQIEMLLEFNLPSEQVTINLEEVDILKEYLSGVSDTQQQISNMKLTPINLQLNETLYLLQFSCYNDNCSYLLLDQNEDGRSFLVSDLSKLLKFSLSEENNKLLMIFRRVSIVNETLIQKDNLVVMDIDSWVKLPYSSSTGEKFTNNYQTPILDAIWNEDDSITVTVPNVDSPTEENLMEWYNSSEKSTKEQLLSIEEIN